MIDIRSIDLGSLGKDDLEKVKVMLDIHKIQQDIAESQARSRQADATLEQIRVTVAKMEKENKWFPWIQIITTMLTGGIVVFFLAYFLGIPKP